MSDSGFGRFVVNLSSSFLSSDDDDENERAAVPVPVPNPVVVVVVVAIDGWALRRDNNLLDDDDDDNDDDNKRSILVLLVIAIFVAIDRFIVAFATVAAVAADSMTAIYCRR